MVLFPGVLEAEGGRGTFITQAGITTGIGGIGRIRIDFDELNSSSFGSSGANSAATAAGTTAIGRVGRLTS